MGVSGGSPISTVKLLGGDWSVAWLAAVLLAAGLCIGNALVKWIVRLADGRPLRPPLHCPSCGLCYRWWMRLPVAGWFRSPGRCRRCGRRFGAWVLWVEIGTGVAFMALTLAVLEGKCQATPEVWPDEAARLAYHLTLVVLLILATGTDLRDYVIPDAVTLTGTLLGLAGAVLSGEVQLIHLWVDWNVETVEVFGPGIPEWFKHHQHLHGLAWSAAGVLAGGGLTWLVRGLSKLVLGREALGFGDVTLMAMIGSFLGWQPVVFVFLLAPLCGLLVALTVRLLSGVTFLPYGPYLTAAALMVLFSWRWLWLATRNVFGDWLSLAVLGTAGLGALIVLLALLRAYRAIPVTRRGGRMPQG